MRFDARRSSFPQRRLFLNSRVNDHNKIFIIENGRKRVRFPVFDASKADSVSCHCIISRDLADNWNIDVAAELEEYLEDLESVVISFDGGKSNLNFAEAALMIQV